MVGLERSLKVTEPWDAWVGLEGSLKGVEMWDGWVERVLEGHRDVGWLGWKGP